MTILEMHYDFDLKIDRVASFSKEDFNRAEKDWLLNEGQLVLLKRKYNVNNFYRAGFENTQKRIDDLSTLHIKFPLQPELSLISHDGVYELDLSTLTYPYLFLTRGWVKASTDDCDDLRIPMKEVQNDDLESILDDPFNSPSIEFIPVNFGRASESDSSSVYLYPGSYQLDSAFVEYLKQPNIMNAGGYAYLDGITYPQTSSDLPTQTHPEIVDMAVAIASGIIEHPTYVQLKERKLFQNE